MKSYILITSQSLRVKEVTYYGHTGVIQEQDIHSNVQNLNDFPKKLIRAVSGASRLLAWDHFR